MLLGLKTKKSFSVQQHEVETTSQPHPFHTTSVTCLFLQQPTSPLLPGRAVIGQEDRLTASRLLSDFKR